MSLFGPSVHLNLIRLSTIELREDELNSRDGFPSFVGSLVLSNDKIELRDNDGNSVLFELHDNGPHTGPDTRYDMKSNKSYLISKATRNRCVYCEGKLGGRVDCLYREVVTYAVPPPGARDLHLRRKVFWAHHFTHVNIECSRCGFGRATNC